MSCLWSVQKCTFVPLKLNYLFFIDSAKETKCCFAINICVQTQFKIGSLVVDTALVHIWNNSITAYRRKKCPLTVFLWKCSDARTELRMCEKAVKGKVRRTFRVDYFSRTFPIYLTVAEAIVNKRL